MISTEFFVFLCWKKLSSGSTDRSHKSRFLCLLIFLMPFCKLCWRSVVETQHHRSNDPIHHRGDRFKCNDCSRWFSSKTARRRHRTSTGCADPPVSQFRCCDCDEDFDFQLDLSMHLNDERIHPPRVVIALGPSAAYCEECKKIFKSTKALEQHLGSVIHNPIMECTACLGGNGCGRVFHTPSGMLAHLESGACPSKLTRRMIDDLVIANDPTNIITDPAAVDTMLRDRMMITSSSYSPSVGGSVMFTPSQTSIAYSSRGSENWDDIFTDGNDSDGVATFDDESSSSDSEDSQSDSDDSRFTSSGTVTPTLDRSSSSIFGHAPTPSISSSSVGGVFLTPSASTSRFFTPSEASFSSQLIPSTFTCPLCPEQNPKQYKDINSLHIHMQSRAHASKIYRCPSPSLMLGSDHKSTGKQRKSFAALSGLAQHVEAGACEGGKETFSAAISLVNEKLKNMGVKDLKLVRN